MLFRDGWLLGVNLLAMASCAASPPWAPCTATYFIPAVLDKLVFSVVVDMQDWVSWQYSWRSPLWQWLEHLAARLAGVEVFQRVRAFVATPSPRTFLEPAASAGFWDTYWCDIFEGFAV